MPLRRGVVNNPEPRKLRHRNRLALSQREYERPETLPIVHSSRLPVFLWDELSYPILDSQHDVSSKHHGKVSIIFSWSPSRH